MAFTTVSTSSWLTSSSKPSEPENIFTAGNFALSVSASPSFSILYTSYQGPFASDQTGFELLDLNEGFDNIVSTTKMIREELDFPDKYIVLTNLLGGSVLILDTNSDGVFNVDFEGGCEELLEGKLQPSWSSFIEFLKWYFN